MKIKFTLTPNFSPEEIASPEAWDKLVSGMLEKGSIPFTVDQSTGKTEDVKIKSAERKGQKIILTLELPPGGEAAKQVREDMFGPTKNHPISMGYKNADGPTNEEIDIELN